MKRALFHGIKFDSRLGGEQFLPRLATKDRLRHTNNSLLLRSILRAEQTDYGLHWVGRWVVVVNRR